MSSPGAPEYDGDPFGPQQHRYTFSGRVLLTAVVVLAILTLVFVLIRLLLFHLVMRGGRGGLAAGLRRSLSSIGRISGSARHGLDAAALAALPVTAYRRRDKDGDGGGGSTSGDAASDCAVCLSELADGEKVRALPSCGHVFHVECVDAWLRSRTTCPVCRAEVVAPPSPKGTAVGEPAMFGAGGTLVVTVQGGAAQTRGPGLGSGQPTVPAG